MTYRFILAAWGRLCGRPSLRRLNNLLLNLGARGLGVGDANPKRNGESKNLRRWSPKYADSKRSPIIFDVGANKGDFTATAIAYCPNAIVHAFEPHPETFTRLQKRFAGSAVRCHPFALGAKAERRELWDYAGEYVGSSHATFYPQIVSSLEQRALKPSIVNVRTLTDVASEQKIDKIALLKLDVEGHELACLDGAADLLSIHAIENIQFEFNAMHLDARVTMHDFAHRLKDFTLFRILPHGRVQVDLRNPMSCTLYRVQNIFAVQNRNFMGGKNAR